MGLLDPKLDKERTFALLRSKGAIKAELSFSGGHDEGNVDGIMLTLETGEEVELPTWYCGGYRITDNGQWVPMSEPANEDEELADLLEGPINAEFGSWGGSPSTEGVLTWDVNDRTVQMNYSQEEWKEYEEVL